jgi:hypothetical protein
MWQDLIVGAIVVLAGLYALWYWMPAALRKRLGRMRPALGKAPSCGACSDCGGCATPARPPATAPGERRAVWMASRH